MRLLICILAALLSSSSHAAAKTSSKPNVLFLIADDWSYPHAGAYGDPIVKTPNFDRIAQQGVLFTEAHSAAPSCTPSRAAILTGRAVHSLEEGSNLHGFLPKKFDVYPDILEKAGYVVGAQGKAWSPGNVEAAGRARNPAGPKFNKFSEFLKNIPDEKPFCFWFGSINPHRPYDKGSGAAAGMDATKVKVPAYWPDTPEVRNDILDYYYEVQLFDQEVGEVLAALKASGREENTLVVITGDNGMPFPRGKANVYGAGTHQPLAIAWPGKIKGGKTIDSFVNLYDTAPTFLEAAGVRIPKEMDGRSLLPLLEGRKQSGRDRVFVERERHANVREGNASFPVRAIRTKEYLYIRNFRPDRWPAGDPEMWFAVGAFGDVDASPTKELILENRETKQGKKFFKLSFGKRPAEELYDLRKDPAEIHNLAGNPLYSKKKKKLRDELDKWMHETGDPRAVTDDDRFDRYQYFGAGLKKKQRR